MTTLNATNSTNATTTTSFVANTTLTTPYVNSSASSTSSGFCFEPAEDCYYSYFAFIGPALLVVIVVVAVCCCRKRNSSKASSCTCCTSPSYENNPVEREKEMEKSKNTFTNVVREDNPGSPKDASVRHKKKEEEKNIKNFTNRACRSGDSTSSSDSALYVNNDTPVGPRCIATKRFKPKQANQIALARDQEVQLMDRTDNFSGWVYVITHIGNRQEKGFVPGTFLKEIPTEALQLSDSVANTTEEQINIRECRVKYVFDGSQPGYLRVNEGEVVSVYREDESGWSMARHSKREEEGWVPTEYLEEIKHVDASMDVQSQDIAQLRTQGSRTTPFKYRSDHLPPIPKGN